MPSPALRLLPRVFPQILASTSDSPPSSSQYSRSGDLADSLSSVRGATFAATPSTSTISNLSEVTQLNVSLGEETVMRFMRKYEEKYDVQDDPVTRTGHL